MQYIREDMNTSALLDSEIWKASNYINQRPPGNNQAGSIGWNWTGGMKWRGIIDETNEN